MSNGNAGAGAPGDQHQEWRPSFSPWLIAATVMAATFMEVLDTSVANVALPHIAGSLSVSTEESTWVLTSYLVSNAIILPMTGWLSSFFGRKQLLIVCIALFTLSSALCGAAPSLGILIVARVLQGIGGGVLQPMSQAVLLESFPVEKRGQAMAIFGMGIVVAPIVGPTLGGWITDNYSWRWIFYINVPIGVVAVFMAQWFIENPPYLQHIGRRAIDYIGFGLMVVWLATFQVVLDKGQQEDWFGSTWIRWFTIISVSAMITFIIRELVAGEPIVDLSVFKDRNFALGTSLMAIVGTLLYGTISMLPLFLQTLLGYTALRSGLAMSPRGIGAMVSMFLVGRLSGKIDDRLLMIAGFAMLALSMHMLSDLTLDIAPTNIDWPNIINGFATGFIFVPLTTAAMGTLRTEQIGNATGIFNLMRNLGGSIGISAVTTLLSRRSQVHQALMVTHLTPYSPAYQRLSRQLQGQLGTRSGDPTGRQQAYAVIYQILGGQARLMAFIDIFRLFMLICLICLPLAFLLRKAQARGGASPMH